MRRKAKVPVYRKRILPQGERAYVTLRDQRTGRVKDYNLGPYGCDASRELYARIVTAWQANGCRIPGDPAHDTSELTITQLCHRYWRAAEPAYTADEMYDVGAVIRLLRKYFGRTPAAGFGPNALRLVRDAMVQGDPDAGPPRKPWSRGYVNEQAMRIRRIFKWAVAHELLPASVHQALCAIEPLRRGQTTARETEPVRPVPEAFVDAVLPLVRPQVRAMVELQRATGMRPGEVCAIRTRDLDMGDHVWTYTPRSHKTARFGHERTVYIGPRGQDVLRPWLGAALDDYLFRPCDVVADQLEERHAARKTPAGYGTGPGTNRRENPTRKPGERYTTASYRRAIQRACDLANRKAREEAIADGHELEEGVRLVPRWHPHQLRHNYATVVRKRFGVEAARIVLGHRSVDVTELYAERDQAVGLKIAGQIG